MRCCPAPRPDLSALPPLLPVFRWRRHGGVLGRQRAACACPSAEALRHPSQQAATVVVRNGRCGRSVCTRRLDFDFNNTCCLVRVHPLLRLSMPTPLCPPALHALPQPPALFSFGTCPLADFLRFALLLLLCQSPHANKLLRPSANLKCKGAAPSAVGPPCWLVCRNALQMQGSGVCGCYCSRSASRLLLVVFGCALQSFRVFVACMADAFLSGDVATTEGRREPHAARCQILVCEGGNGGRGVEQVQVRCERLGASGKPGLLVGQRFQQA